MASIREQASMIVYVMTMMMMMNIEVQFAARQGSLDMS